MPAVPTFSGGTLDRAAHRRADATWLAGARADPRARAVAVAGDGGIAGRVAVGEEDLLLGEAPDGSAVFAREAREGDVLVSLRELAATLDPAEAGLLATAAGLVNWHRTHAFCPTCGQASEIREAGWSRLCPEGHASHPRTDPVVIMLVVDPEADRVLMGRQPSWPPGRFSALAGFVEPGEALEAAVARECAEEAGIAVGAVRYVASQPWPFPASLMLGFEAEWDGGDARVADEELEAVRWFGRAEVQAAAREDRAWEDDDADRKRLGLPPTLAIARTLLDGWLARGAETGRGRE